MFANIQDDAQCVVLAVRDDDAGGAVVAEAKIRVDGLLAAAQGRSGRKAPSSTEAWCELYDPMGFMSRGRALLRVKVQRCNDAANAVAKSAVVPDASAPTEPALAEAEVEAVPSAPAAAESLADPHFEVQLAPVALGKLPRDKEARHTELARAVALCGAGPTEIGNAARRSWAAQQFDAISVVRRFVLAAPKDIADAPILRAIIPALCAGVNAARDGGVGGTNLARNAAQALRELLCSALAPQLATAAAGEVAAGPSLFANVADALLRATFASSTSVAQNVAAGATATASVLQNEASSALMAALRAKKCSAAFAREILGGALRHCTAVHKSVADAAADAAATAAAGGAAGGAAVAAVATAATASTSFDITASACATLVEASLAALGVGAKAGASFIVLAADRMQTDATEAAATAAAILPGLLRVLHAALDTAGGKAAAVGALRRLRKGATDKAAFENAAKQAFADNETAVAMLMQNSDTKAEARALAKAKAKAAVAMQKAKAKLDAKAAKADKASADKVGKEVAAKNSKQAEHVVPEEAQGEAAEPDVAHADAAQAGAAQVDAAKVEPNPAAVEVEVAAKAIDPENPAQPVETEPAGEAQGKVARQLL